MYRFTERQQAIQRCPELTGQNIWWGQANIFLWALYVVQLQILMYFESGGEKILIKEKVEGRKERKEE